MLPLLAASVRFTVNLSSAGVLLGAPMAGASPADVSPTLPLLDSVVVPTIARVTSRRDSGGIFFSSPEVASVARRRDSSSINAARICAEVTWLCPYSTDASIQAVLARSTLVGDNAGARELPALITSSSRFNWRTRRSEEHT